MWPQVLLKKLDFKENLSYSFSFHLNSHLGKVNIETLIEFVFVDKFVEYFGQDVKYLILDGEISEPGKRKAE